MSRQTERDPERLRVGGTVAAGRDDRALLSAPPPEPSAQLRREVKRALQVRVQAQRARGLRWRPVALVTAAVLGGGTLAFALAVGTRWGAGAPAAGPAPAPRPRVSMQEPEVVEVPATPPPAIPARSARAAAPPPASARRIDHGLGEPGLKEPPRGLAEPAAAAPAPSSPPPGSLVITRAGRRAVAIELAGNQVRGDVRGVPVALTLAERRIEGNVGGEPVFLLLRGDEATGTIANHEVSFHLTHQDGGGFLVRGALPAHTAQVESTATTLTWYPGCDEALTAPAPRAPDEPAQTRVYDGRCAGGAARVRLPDAWLRLPALTRHVLLALLLPERDPGVPDSPPALFGPPDWPRP